MSEQCVNGGWRAHRGWWVSACPRIDAAMTVERGWLIWSATLVGGHRRFMVSGQLGVIGPGVAAAV